MGKFQGGTWCAQCEHLEISSLPRCAGKTDVPDKWWPSFGEPAAAGRWPPQACNRDNRYNRFGMSVAGRFANYIYKTSYRDVCQQALGNVSPIGRDQVSCYELTPVKTYCILPDGAARRSDDPGDHRGVAATACLHQQRHRQRQNLL